MWIIGVLRYVTYFSLFINPPGAGETDSDDSLIVSALAYKVTSLAEKLIEASDLTKRLLSLVPFPQSLVTNIPILGYVYKSIFRPTVGALVNTVRRHVVLT